MKHLELRQAFCAAWLLTWIAHSEISDAFASTYTAKTIDGGQAGQLDQPSVQMSGVLIVNASSTSLSFSIRPDGGEWSVITLTPGQQANYICDGCVVDKFNFVIITGDVRIEYDLPTATRYKLEFNSQKKAWDLYTN